MDDKVVTDVAAEELDRSLGDAALDAFVEWFIVYWRTRGSELFHERLEDSGEVVGDG